MILASTGIRIGALGPMKLRDLERIDDLYKVDCIFRRKRTVYTFTTPEAAKEIDAYLEFRKRKRDLGRIGEKAGYLARTKQKKR